MISATKELIRLHTKQLRMPTFAQYEEVERQLEPSAGYDEFLLELLKRELNERQSSSQKRRIKQRTVRLHSKGVHCSTCTL